MMIMMVMDDEDCDKESEGGGLSEDVANVILARS